MDLIWVGEIGANECVSEMELLDGGEGKESGKTVRYPLKREIGKWEGE